MTRTQAIEQSRGPLAMTEANYRKVVAGAKRQTRRICDPYVGEFNRSDFHGPEWFTPAKVDRNGEEYPGEEVFGIWSEHEWGKVSRYVPGAIYYLPEPVNIQRLGELIVGQGAAKRIAEDGYWKPTDKGPFYLAEIRYMWNGFVDQVRITEDELDRILARKRGPYATTTARFMLKSFAREFVRIKSVKVERLNEITEADSKAEGLKDTGYDIYHTTARFKFSRLWDSINAKREGGICAWDRNPWVWVYEFERMEIGR